MESCVIYLRKSRADLEAESRGEGETLSRHRAALLELARQRSLKVDEIYCEIVSGETIAARPMMQTLLREVSEGRWYGVLVMEVERLARGDTMDQGLVAQTFRYSGTKIITPLKIYDPENEFDEEYFEFGLFMSRREYVTTNRRLQRGRRASAEEGKFTGSTAPFGYRRVKIEGDKGWTLEIVPEQAEIVRMIFALYLNGGAEGSKRPGLRGVAHRLNELHIPAVRHAYWQKETIRDIITNPVYAGFIRWGYRKVRKTITPCVTADGHLGKAVSRPVCSDDCVIVRGLHAPIISEGDFQRARELLGERRGVPVAYKREVRNPLCGLVVCKKCGRKMVLRRGSGGKPDYLKCHSGDCDMVSSPFHLVERRLLEILEQWLGGYFVKPAPAPDLVSETRCPAQNALRRELAALEAQRGAVYDLLERGTYTDAEFKSRLDDITRRVGEIGAVLDKLGTEEHPLPKSDNAPPRAMGILEIYRALPTAAAKNELLKEVLDCAVYDKGGSGSRKGHSADEFTLVLFPKLPED